MGCIKCLSVFNYWGEQESATWLSADRQWMIESMLRKIATLVGMGFTDTQSRNALDGCSGNVERAEPCQQDQLQSSCNRQLQRPNLMSGRVPHGLGRMRSEPGLG